MWLRFLCPFGVFFHLYAKTITQKMAWVFYYAMPFFLLALYWGDSFFYVTIGLASIYSVYEIGYIYNNAETIKKENAPTLRFSDEDLCFYENKKVIIFASKFFISLLLAFLLVGEQKIIYFFLWVALFFLAVVVFFIYNSYRGIANFYLQLPLSVIRFSGPFVLLFCGYVHWWVLLVVSFFFYFHYLTLLKGRHSRKIIFS